MKFAGAISILFSFPLSLSAVVMSGGEYEVRITMAGAASAPGNVAADAGQGNRVLRAVGFVATGLLLTHADGTTVVPGLFGGSPGMIPYTMNWTESFGNASSPSSLFIAANSLSQDYMVFTTSSPVRAPLRVSPLTVQSANDSLIKNGLAYTRPVEDRIWEVHFLQADGSALAPTSKIRGTLTLPYTDENPADGAIDGTWPPVRASTLSVWWLDEDHGMWVRLPQSKVDAAAKTVTADVRYASVFALMGSPDVEVANVRAVPSPWRPNGPRAGLGAGGSGTSADGILFNNIPQEGTIRIYTLSGVLVRELPLDGTPQRRWDGKNASGEDVVTDVYVFTVESAGNRKSGKVAVIR